MIKYLIPPLILALTVSLARLLASQDHQFKVPLFECAEDLRALSPRQQSILVHGSSQAPYRLVSFDLAVWYCRRLGVEQAHDEIHRARVEISEIFEGVHLE